MHDQPEALSGPDFLDNIADNENGDGRHINGAEYRRRANQWRETEAALRRAAETVVDLQHRLDRATRALAA